MSRNDTFITSLKLIVLLSPLIAALLCNLFDGSESVLLLLLAWIIFMCRAFGENIIQANYKTEADWFVLALAVEKTMWYLTPKTLHSGHTTINTNTTNLSDLSDMPIPETNSLYVITWLVPIIANLVYSVIYEHDPSYLITGAEQPNGSNSDRVEISFFSRLVVFVMLGGSLFVRWGADYFYLQQSSALYVYTIYAFIDVLFALYLCFRINFMRMDEDKSEILEGFGMMLFMYMYYQLLTLSYSSDPVWKLFIVIGMYVFIVCVSIVLCSKNINKAEALLEALWHMIKTLFTNLEKNDKWLRLMYLVFVSYLVMVTYKGGEWYYSHVDFDHGVFINNVYQDGRSLTCPIVSIVESSAASDFFTLTNRKDVTELLFTFNLLPQVSNVRNKLRSFISNIFPQLLKVCRGISMSVSPDTSFVILITMLGPIYVGLFIALQVFPVCERVVSSVLFWSTAIIFTVIHAFFSLYIADIEITMWGIILTFISSTNREYTSTGHAVIFSYCCMIVICVLILRSQIEAAINPVIKALLDMSGSGKKADPVGAVVVGSVDALKSLLGVSVMCKTLSIIILIVLIVNENQPFSHINIVRTPAYMIQNPIFAVMTVTDYVGVAEAKLASIADVFISTQEKIALFAISQIVSQLNGACRCVGVGDACVTVCAGSLLGSIADLVAKGISLGTQEIGTLLGNIPHMGDINNFIKSLYFLDGIWTTFSLLSIGNFINSPDLSIPDLTLDLPLDLSVNIKSFAKTTGFLIGLCVIGVLLVIIKFASFLFPIATALEYLFVAALVSILSSLFALILMSQSVLQSLGYRIDYAFSSYAWLYVTSMLLMFAGVITNSGSDVDREVKKTVSGGYNTVEKRGSRPYHRLKVKTVSDPHEMQSLISPRSPNNLFVPARSNIGRRL
jgi:hypothetical protein